MDRIENDVFIKRIKLMAISSLIAIGTFAVAAAVWYYVEHLWPFSSSWRFRVL